MTDLWIYQHAVFARWQGGITVFGFAYKAEDGIESGTGHHTKLQEAWLEGTHLHFHGADGRTYRVMSRAVADFSDATDAYDEVLSMTRGEE